MFTHGMNLDTVETAKSDLQTLQQDIEQTKTDIKGKLDEFHANDWWGEDSENYQSDWADTVDKSFDDTNSHFEDEVIPELERNIEEQDETSSK